MDNRLLDDGPENPEVAYLEDMWSLWPKQPPGCIAAPGCRAAHHCVRILTGRVAGCVLADEMPSPTPPRDGPMDAADWLLALREARQEPSGYEWQTSAWADPAVTVSTFLTLEPAQQDALAAYVVDVQQAAERAGEVLVGHFRVMREGVLEVSESLQAGFRMWWSHMSELIPLIEQFQHQARVKRAGQLNHQYRRRLKARRRR